MDEFNFAGILPRNIRFSCTRSGTRARAAGRHVRGGARNRGARACSVRLALLLYEVDFNKVEKPLSYFSHVIDLQFPMGIFDEFSRAYNFLGRLSR